MGVITFILAAFTVIAIRCLYLLRFPWGPCRRCQGRKTNKGSKVRYEIGKDGSKQRVAKDGTKISDIRYSKKK